MSSSTNPVKVGVFVLAGLALMLAVVLTLGANRLFSRRVPFVLYFADSVHGLTVGSAVKFKGVPIGTVTRIQVALREEGPQYIPVHVEVDEDLILSAAGEPVDIRDRAFVRQQVDKGLRASLELESFITGRLYVQFDYYTNAGPPEYRQKHGTDVEIPTRSTGLPEFLKSLERVDLAGMSHRINTVLEQLQQLLEGANIKQLTDQADRTLHAVEGLVRSPELTNALVSISQAAEEATRLLADTRGQISPLAARLTNSIDRAALTLDELRQTAAELRQLISSDSPLMGELQAALAQFTEAASAVRRLADFLNRNPRALLTGRKLSETSP
jgi:paraquat-inducible protein B